MVRGAFQCAQGLSAGGRASKKRKSCKKCSIGFEFLWGGAKINRENVHVCGQFLKTKDKVCCFVEFSMGWDRCFGSVGAVVVEQEG